MKTTTKIGLGLGTAITAVGIWIGVRPSQQNACAQAGPLTASQLSALTTEANQAAQLGPPGWDFCTMPSYYTRACEACPYTLRWSGPAPGTCPTIAICGAHTKPCGGDDGITYAMMDQGGGRYYPKPQVSAGEAIRSLWDQCYVQKINVWGSSYPCATAPLPGGVQAPLLLTWNQLPEGGQKNAWGQMFGCGATTPTPTTIPTVTPVPIPPAGHPLAAWAEQLSREGITAGCGPGAFCPDDKLTRAQAAVWLLKHEHGANYVPPPCTGLFPVDTPCPPPGAKVKLP